MQNFMPSKNWVDNTEYPFQSKYLKTEQGNIHYIDEGQGDTFLFVHGTPTWSFLYRNYIKKLSKAHRCIALDHLGFGLSEKPKTFPGTPDLHSKNLTNLVEKLGLKNITLVVHDFGGPIGLSYAISNPQNINRIILFNTWLWGTRDDKDAQRIDKILHSRLGNFLYLHTNFSARILLRSGFKNKSALTKKIHKHYQQPFPNRNSRYALLRIGRSLLGSSDWYENQWSKIDCIKDKPFLILWGENDGFIKKSNLKKWQDQLSNATTFVFESGHFVQEEAFEASMHRIDNWLQEFDH